ncbi:homoserine kinase [Bacillus sp. FJAT-50079]|uniref:homoserine kinase n=1 Tax=Bacillus sp. FJAT-50079 TaxID=2833577 RepID=UPI001BC976D7|nr:homoserine kinase [Bacillus sp. FJAT-50079]MBS4209294.1 homoserine kinase [Bacillus sp. FJAT-50079]
MTRFTIKVPASTANLGPGFDSAGMALTRYLTLHLEEHDEWMFEHHSVHLPEVNDAKEHFIYQIAKKTAEHFGASLPAAHVVVESEIPLARGLGSSSSAIIAGIEIANQLCKLHLSKMDKLYFAAAIEGHPDNVAPTVLGGLVIASQSSNEEINYFQKKDDNLDFIVYIPSTELKTEASREVLPEQYSRQKATSASAIANVMFASLIAGDYELAGEMMEKDLYHEPYRASLIPNYEKIRHEAKKRGAYGTVISGAGPTMLSLAPKGKGAEIAAALQDLLPNYSVDVLEMDLHGVQVEEK